MAFESKRINTRQGTRRSIIVVVYVHKMKKKETFNKMVHTHCENNKYNTMVACSPNAFLLVSTSPVG